MLCAILYLENSDKSRISNIRKRVGNDYVLNKAEHPRTVTAVQSLLLNHQPSYNYNRNYQSNRVSNHIMFAQRVKTGDGEGDRKEKEQRPRRNMDHITCKKCVDKGYRSVNSECSTQIKLKEDAEAFKNMKQEKSSNKPPGGGYQKVLVNAKDTPCSLMVGAPTKEWGKPPSPGLMFFQNLTKEVLQTEPINNNMKMLTPA